MDPPKESTQGFEIEGSLRVGRILRAEWECSHVDMAGCDFREITPRDCARMVSLVFKPRRDFCVQLPWGIFVMLTEGQVIGSYRIRRKLGEGGMGAVFEAVNSEIGRTAAIKVLHPQFAQNPQVATRFLNEARAANAINHPGVVEVFEFNRLPDGTTFIVMEFLAGESLAHRLAKGPIGPDTVRIVRQIASVLAAAHEKNIVHRD